MCLFMCIRHEKLAPYFRTLSSTPCKTPTNVQCGHEYILLKKDINKDNSFILTKCVQVIFSILLFFGKYVIEQGGRVRVPQRFDSCCELFLPRSYVAFSSYLGNITEFVLLPTTIAMVKDYRSSPMLAVLS